MSHAFQLLSFWFYLGAPDGDFHDSNFRWKEISYEILALDSALRDSRIELLQVEARINALVHRYEIEPLGSARLGDRRLPRSIRVQPFGSSRLGDGSLPRSIAIDPLGSARLGDRVLPRNFPSPRLTGSGRLGDRPVARSIEINNMNFNQLFAERAHLLDYQSQLLSRARELALEVHHGEWEWSQLDWNSEEFGSLEESFERLDQMVEDLSN